jgi:methionyl-tRNA synthetase
VNTLGNCASRVSAMIGKYCDSRVPDPGDSMRSLDGSHWPQLTDETVRACWGAYESFDLPSAVNSAVALVRHIDGFINATEPFKLAKDESKRDDVALILYQCAEALRIASLLLWPVCPDKIAELWRALGQNIDPSEGQLQELAQWGGLKPGTRVDKTALFPRVELQATAAE